MSTARAGKALGAYVACEVAAGLLIRALRKDFPWLIGPSDTAPRIPDEVIARHVTRSFDSELGWCRKPGERGTERTDIGTTSFSVDSRGRRNTPGHGAGSAPVACFGDSFVFCRLVDDHETWPFHLAERIGQPVDNYGVGNYGLDQALLRFERELPDLPASVVIMGVVPETIARIQSYWKHYFEYGNTLAFKPRFTLGPRGLTYHPSVIRVPEDYRTCHELLPAIQRLDGFYRRKFRQDLLAVPYLPRLIRRWRRHAPLLWHLLVGRTTGRRELAFRRAFRAVLRDNASWTRRLYGEPDATALLTALVGRFADTCRAAGKKPLLVILPQPTDLEHDSTPHEAVFAAMRTILPVADLTAAFRDAGDRPDLFAHGRLGPHPSDLGNRLIADHLMAKVTELLRTPSAHADEQDLWSSRIDSPADSAHRGRSRTASTQGSGTDD